MIYQLANTRTEILPLATFHIAIAHLRKQFNDIFALLISMHVLKSVNFHQNMGLKFSYFCKKKYKFSSAWCSAPAYGGWGALLLYLQPPADEGFALRPPKQSPSIVHFWLRA